MKEDKEKFDYLDNKITINGNYIESDDIEVHSQLNIGGIQQVLASRFGRNNRDYILAIEWLKLKKISNLK